MLLSVSAGQLDSLHNQQEARFLETLRQHIQQQYRAYAEVSPRIMTRLIGFGVARARSYGFTWQSTLGQFVYLMAAIAPNFDLQPAIHAVLLNPGVPVENRISSLSARLPDGVWDDAVAAASTIGWFLTEDAFQSTRPQRIAAALPNALPGIDQRSAMPLNLVEQAVRQAESLGFIHEDQQWVFSAACLHYGQHFVSELAWARETFIPAYPLPTQIALLRVRMALDAGIWI